MNRILVVGDPHAVLEELDECRRLFEYVEKVAAEQKVTEIVILGDLNNTHNVVRVEVMNFWLKTLRRLGKVAFTKALVGNHDYAGEGSEHHSLAIYDGDGYGNDEMPGVEIVDRPVWEFERLYLPYYPVSKHDEFVKTCNDPKTPFVPSHGNLLFCHQAFVGSKLDNGFFAPDAVDPNLLPQKLVISGHIHSPQRVGKVIYVGSPRWRTMDDANKDRSIRLFEIDNDGNLVSDTPFPTNTVCREIRRAIDTPEHPVVIPAGDRARWYIDVRGPADWVEERKKAFSGTNARIRTFKTTAQTVRVRESEGIAVAFNRFLGGYAAQVPMEVLQKMAKERLHV